MSDTKDILQNLAESDYKWGFTTNIATETLKKGLNEDVIRFISAKKNEPKFMLDFRLKAFAKWKTMIEPHWAHLDYLPVDYQDIVYNRLHDSSH